MYYSVVIVLLRIMVSKVESKQGRCGTFTSAPMTPREVRRRYSNGRVLEVVFKNG